MDYFQDGFAQFSNKLFPMQLWKNAKVLVTINDKTLYNFVLSAWILCLVKNNQLLEIVMDNNIFYNIPNFEFKEQRNDMKLFNYDNNDINFNY